MKQVPIKKLSNDEWTNDVMVGILSMPANGQGVTVDEMERVLPIIKKLEGVDKVDVGVTNVILEDAEHKELVERLRTYNGWSRNAQELYDLVMDVERAPEFDYKADAAANE